MNISATTSSKQYAFVRFIFAGGASAGVNYLSRIFYGKIFSFMSSIVVAYLTGMLVAYFLFKNFVFSGQGRPSYFILTNIVAILQVITISSLLCRCFTVISFKQKELIHFIAISTPLINSYLRHKYFSFRG